MQLSFAFRERTSRADMAGLEELAACNVHLRYTKTAQTVAQSLTSHCLDARSLANYTWKSIEYQFLAILVMCIASVV